MSRPKKALAEIMKNPEPERDIYTLDNPNSVINLVPPYVQDILRAVDPKYLEMEENDLRRVVKPTAIMNRLRIRFWDEYDYAASMGRNMRMTKVYQGVCHTDYWLKQVCKSPVFFAWISCPPVNYEVAMKDLLDESIRQLRKVITAEIVDTNGKMNTRAAEIFLKAYALVDIKVHGMPILRSENKTLQVNMNHEMPVGSEASLPVDQNGQFTLEGVELKLAELKRKQAELSQVAVPRGEGAGEELLKLIDVTPPKAPEQDYRLVDDATE